MYDSWQAILTKYHDLFVIFEKEKHSNGHLLQIIGGTLWLKLKKNYIIAGCHLENITSNNIQIHIGFFQLVNLDQESLARLGIFHLELENLLLNFPVNSYGHGGVIEENTLFGIGNVA